MQSSVAAARFVFSQAASCTIDSFDSLAQQGGADLNHPGTPRNGEGALSHYCNFRTASLHSSRFPGCSESCSTVPIGDEVPTTTSHLHLRRPPSSQTLNSVLTMCTMIKTREELDNITRIQYTAL